MTERDYVDDVLTIQHTGVFDFNGLYRLLKNWLKQYKYNFSEPTYRDQKEEGNRKVKIKWVGKKKINEYACYVLETEITLNNFEEVMVKKKKLAKADLQVSFSAFIEKDYEEAWYRTSFLKFIREVYDKFAQGAQYEKMEKELKGNMRSLVQEIKEYLSLFKARD